MSRRNVRRRTHAIVIYGNGRSLSAAYFTTSKNNKIKLRNELCKADFFPPAGDSATCAWNMRVGAAQSWRQWAFGGFVFAKICYLWCVLHGREERVRRSHILRSFNKKNVWFYVSKLNFCFNEFKCTCDSFIVAKKMYTSFIFKTFFHNHSSLL